MDRSEALSAFTANLRRSNTALIPARDRLFWNGLSLLLFALCVMFAVLASGR